MKSIPLEPDLFRSIVSLEPKHNGVKPWRIPYDRIELFPPDGLKHNGEMTAGVRLAFATDTVELQLTIEPAERPLAFDCVIEGEIVATMSIVEGEDTVRFTSLPIGFKEIEIYLPPVASVTLLRLQIDEGAGLSALAERRLRWVTYGSSITQCAAAASPAQTWPAIVARQRGWDLTCFGFGGNCHMEPMVARMIRDREADFISLCLGINIMGQSSLSERTFRASVFGSISLIREKHPDIPIAVISPIYCRPRETTENAVGLTLVRMREEIREAVDILKRYGDEKLWYIDGLTIFGEEHASHLPDQLHPDAEGYRIMAHNMLEQFSRIPIE